MIQGGIRKKQKSKGGAGKSLSKPKTKGKEKSEDVTCFHCKKSGHWKRNCKIYLEEVKKSKGKALEAGTAGMTVIDVNISILDNWVLDTGGGTHICRNMQVLQNRRKLARGEVDLRVGNGAKVAALAVGEVYLTLPSGLF